jgi:hypothetical protein
LLYTWELYQITKNYHYFPCHTTTNFLLQIMGVTRPNGKEHFIAAAFPSACGKTNLAMLEPTLPGWRVRVVGMLFFLLPLILFIFR